MCVQAQAEHAAAVRTATEEHEVELAAHKAAHEETLRQREEDEAKALAEAERARLAAQAAADALEADLVQQRKAHDDVVKAKQAEWDKAVAAHQAQLSARSCISALIQYVDRQTERYAHALAASSQVQAIQYRREVKQAR